MTIRRIDPMSLAKIMGIIYAILGLAIALPAGCMAATFESLAGESGILLGGVGIFMVILYPVLLGIVGFVGGLLIALIYNLVAGRLGGVQLDVETTPRPAADFR